MAGALAVVDFETGKALSEEKKTELRRDHAAATARGRRRRRPPLGTGTPCRQEQARLARKIGERMREAREMNGYTQLWAARKLGYSNSSKLAKMECGQEGHKSIQSIPLWALRKAAMLYQVSLDYLFGVTETMESDEPRRHAQSEMILLMLEDWERQRWRDMLAIRSVQDEMADLEQMHGVMLDNAMQAQEALQRVRELDQAKWEEVPGGARLERIVEANLKTAKTIERRISRLKSNAKQASGANQMKLDLTYG